MSPLSNLVCCQASIYLAIAESFSMSPHYIHTVNDNVLPLKEVQTFSLAILKKCLSALLLENGSSHVKPHLTSVFKALEKQQKAKNRNVFSGLSRILY